MSQAAETPGPAAAGRSDAQLKRVAAGIFLLAVLVRTILLFTTWGDLRHGTAAPYASAAIGLCTGAGLTISDREMTAVSALRSNLSGDYLKLRADGPRQPFTEFLPGPAIVLAGLWRLLPVHNFLPLLALQILLESLAIAALFLVLAARCGRRFSLLVAVLTALNVVAIRRTLMMGYDFWPQFSVLLLFIGALRLQWWRQPEWLWLVLGSMVGLVAWFREVTLLLPFFVAVHLAVRGYRTRRWRGLAIPAMLVAPVVLSIGLLSLYRFELTGSARPTRSTFWHTFFAGIGQFSNPYGLKNDDLSVWEFGRKIAPELSGKSLGEMYLLPDSPYEQALRHEAREVVATHPWMLVRNVIYRWGIIASPLLYASGDLGPAWMSLAVLPVGLAMLGLWIMGLVYWRREQPDLFWLCLAIFLYFCLAFGWFYVNGRVMIPYLFVTALVDLGGLKLAWDLLRARSGWGRSRATAG